MPIQAKPELVEYRNRLKFGTSFQYTVADHGTNDVEADNYFHSLSSNYLKPGDDIFVCVKAPGCWHKAVFEVQSTSATTTTVAQLTPWRSGGDAPIKLTADEAPSAKPVKPLRRPPPPAKVA
jgi:hypothetical protein